MNIRLYNARIMSMEEPGVITEGEIWINDNVIRYVGEAKEQEEAQEISEERKERLSPFTFTKCNIQPGETIYFTPIRN